jgi:hypothetical protein
MAGPTGDITCSAVPLRAAVNVADQSYFLRARATHDFVVSGYVLEPVTGSPALILAWPALGPTGEVRSVLFASLDLGWIHQLAERARLPPGSSFVVTDASGIVLAGYPESERSVGQPMPESEVTQAIRAQQSEAKVTVESLNGRNARLFAFTAVGGGPPADRLYVSVGISRAMVFTEADRTLVRNLLSLGWWARSRSAWRPSSATCSSSGGSATWSAPPSSCGPAISPRARRWMGRTRSR